MDASDLAVISRVTAGQTRHCSRIYRSLLCCRYLDEGKPVLPVMAPGQGPGRWMMDYRGGLLAVALLLVSPTLAADDQVQRIRLVGGSYFFTPERIRVKVGVPVELRVSKEPGLVPHSLIIWSPRMGIDVDVPLEEKEKIVRFTPQAVGTLIFHCREKLLFFASHRDRGMVGTLEVVE